MADYRDLFRNPENQNWAKTALAVQITRDGLLEFVKQAISSLHNTFLLNIGQTSAVSCSNCDTSDVLPCPTRKLCHRIGRWCKFHKSSPRQCPNNVCDNFKCAIEADHRFQSPSWTNTDARYWCSNAWEIAKCYLPPDGYKTSSSAEETDFNGIISIIINSSSFDLLLGNALATPHSIFNKAREVGRAYRHCPDLKISLSEVTRSMAILTNVLRDKGLANDSAANDAINRLNQLDKDTLKITSEEARTLLEEAIAKVSESLKTDFKREQIKTAENLKVQLQQMLEPRLEKLERETSVLKHMQRRTGKKLTRYMKAPSGDGYCNHLKALQRDLAEFYIERKSSVLLSSDAKTADVPINEIYSSPKILGIPFKLPGLVKENEPTESEMLHEKQVLIYSRQVSNTAQVYKYEDIFVCESKRVKNIYIRGEPGSGKSTFSKKLALDWSKTVLKLPIENHPNDLFSDVKYLERFKLVFLVSLQYVKHSDCDTISMIRSTIIEELPNKQHFDIRFLDRVFAKENVLVLLDALDDWTHPRNICDRHPKIIPHRSSGTNSTFITLSRPWKLTDPSFIDSLSDKSLLLDGVNNPTLFLEKVIGFLNKKYKCKRTLKAFRSETKTVEHLIKNPITANQLLCLWFEKKMLPKSRSQMYACTVNMLGNRHQLPTDTCTKPEAKLTKRMPTCFREESWCLNNFQLMKCVGKVAFNTLHCDDNSSRNLFQEEILLHHMDVNLARYALEAGFLTKHKIPCLSKEKSCFSFLHKTFQEFWAAFYFVVENQISTELANSLKYFYRGHRVLNIEEFFVFVCGMDENKTKTLSDFIWTNILNVIGKDILHVHKKKVSAIIKRLYSMSQRGYDELEWNGLKASSIPIKFAFTTNAALSVSRRITLTTKTIGMIISGWQDLGHKLMEQRYHVVFLYLSGVVIDDFGCISGLENLEYLRLDKSQLTVPESSTDVSLNTPYLLCFTGKLKGVSLIDIKCHTCSRLAYRKEVLLNLNGCANLSYIEVRNCQALVEANTEALMECEFCEYDFSKGNIVESIKSSNGIKCIEVWNCQNVSKMLQSLSDKTSMRKIIFNLSEFKTKLPDLQSTEKEIGKRSQHSCLESLESKLPSGLEDLEISGVKIRVWLENAFSCLQTLVLHSVMFETDIDLHLPGSLLNLKISKVTMTVHSWSKMLKALPKRLLKATFQFIDIGDICISLPLNLQYLEISNVKMTHRAWSQTLMELYNLKDKCLKQITIDDDDIVNLNGQYLRVSCHELHLTKVSMHIESWKELIKNVNGKDILTCSLSDCRVHDSGEKLRSLKEELNNSSFDFYHLDETGVTLLSARKY